MTDRRCHPSEPGVPAPPADAAGGPRLRRIILLLLWATACACPGCGGRPAPVLAPVSGTVTVDGKPLAEGFMYFKTIATGILERVEIRAGQFEGKAQIGNRRVEIIANRPKRVVIDGKEVEVPENYIDPAFNTESTLAVEVVPERQNQFTFAVKSRPPG